MTRILMYLPHQYGVYLYRGEKFSA